MLLWSAPQLVATYLHTSNENVYSVLTEVASNENSSAIYGPIGIYTKIGGIPASEEL